MLYLTFGIKLLFYVDKASLLKNINNTLKANFSLFQDLFKKSLEMENNQLQYGDFILFQICLGDDDQQPN